MLGCLESDVEVVATRAKVVRVVALQGPVQVLFCGQRTAVRGSRMTARSSFGDNVRVSAGPDTVARGLAGEVGVVFGETTPSVTGVEVIGVLLTDYAINVHFEHRKQSFWFAPELLEFVDHAPGTEIRLDGVPKKWTRAADGSWIEEETIGPTKRKPSRKFW